MEALRNLSKEQIQKIVKENPLPKEIKIKKTQSKLEMLEKYLSDNYCDKIKCIDCNYNDCLII